MSPASPTHGYITVLSDIEIIIITIKILYEEHLNAYKCWTCPLCVISYLVFYVWRNPAFSGLWVRRVPINLNAVNVHYLVLAI